MDKTTNYWNPIVPIKCIFFIAGFKYNNNDLSQLLIIFAKDNNEYNSFSGIDTFNKHVKNKKISRITAELLSSQLINATM